MATRGRPRAFDRDTALRAAMKLFRLHGYEGTSVAMLTEELGIATTSLYAAFGSKEQLFEAAIELYDRPGESPTGRALAYVEMSEVVKYLLRDNADAYTDVAMPCGCMVGLSALNLGADHDHIGRRLAERRRRDAKKIEARIRRRIADGDLPAGPDVATAAAYLQTELHGLSIQARDGCGRTRARKIAAAAVRGWDALTTTVSSSGLGHRGVCAQAWCSVIPDAAAARRPGLLGARWPG